MRWPSDTPAEVKALAERVISVLEGSDTEVVGPAISLTYAYVILSLAGDTPDVAVLDRITADLSGSRQTSVHWQSSTVQPSSDRRID
jgi:hypothetical protein